MGRINQEKLIDILPFQYATGNPGIDKLIVKALAKEKVQKSQGIEHIVSPVQLVQAVEAVKENKYHVKDVMFRTYADGTIFASVAEMERWDYLLKIQMAGEISELEAQVPFVLQDEFISKQYGRIKPIVYVADFVYLNHFFRKGLEGKKIVEDSKTGVRTPEYRNKRKMFLKRYPHLYFFEV